MSIQRRFAAPILPPCAESMIIVNNPANLKIIFVLESPYKDEIIHGHSLAGDSGLAVTSYLKHKFSQENPASQFQQPFGCELTKVGSETYFGVMNSSEYPLDRKCYPCRLPAHMERIVFAFDFIRTNPKSRRCNDEFNEKVSRCLKNLYKRRLHRILKVNSTVLFVPCGQLAANFLSSCQIEEIYVLPTVRHPSRRAWENVVSPELDEKLRDFNSQSTVE